MRLDGVDIDTSGAFVIGSGQWRGLTLPMTNGARKIQASKPINVIVYGYDHNISYAYNGGLNFKPLWALE
jgi:hypothetical protein